MTSTPPTPPPPPPPKEEVAVLNDRAAKALDYAQESVKQMLALSTGVVALTLTFFQDFAGAASGIARDAMLASWILFFASIICGMASLLSMTSNLWPKEPAGRKKLPSIWTSEGYQKLSSASFRGSPSNC